MIPLKDQLSHILQEHFSALDTTQPLSHQLNSLQMVSLVVLIEESFQVKIHPLEMTSENFSSLETMSNLLRRKGINTAEK